MGPKFQCSIVYVLSGLSATSAEAEGRATSTANTENKLCEKVVLPKGSNLQPSDYRSSLAQFCTSVHINFQLDSYDFAHDDISTKAGGAGFFVKDKTDFVTRDGVKLNLPNVEDLWIEIDGKPKFVVGLI